MQTRSRLNLSSQVWIMLPGYTWHSISRLASTIGTMTSGTNVRKQLLSYTEMLARPNHGIGVRNQTRKITRQGNDVMLVTERRMRRHHLHCRILACSRSEHGQLLFQVAPLLAGKVRDGAIRRTPGIRLMTNYARRVETASARVCGCRLRRAKDCQGQHDQ